MPDRYQAYDQATGRYWDWDGSKWNLRPQPSVASRVWSAANKPLVPKSVTDFLVEPGDVDEKAKQRFIATGHPTLARIAAFREGAAKDTGDLLGSFTSPIGLALALATGLEGTAAKAGLPQIRTLLRLIQTGAGLGFGGLGASSALQKRKAGETGVDELQRRLEGLSQAVLGLTGAYSGTEAPRKYASREALGIGNRGVELAKTGAEAKAAGESSAYAQKVAEKRADFDARQAERNAQYEAKKAASQAKHEADVEAVKRGYSESVSQAERARIRESRLATQKESLSRLKDRLSSQAADNIRSAERSERSSLDSRWQQFRDETQGVNVNWADVQNAVIDAEDNILKGSPENIALFRNILKEGEGGQATLADASIFRGREGIDVKEFLSSIRDPIRRDQFIREMAASGTPTEELRVAREGTTVPVDTARGFYTELGNKLFGREIPGDVYRAIKSVQDAVDKSTESALRNSKGEPFVAKYQQLKDDWSDYMRTWRDMRPLNQGGSPLARVIRLQESPLATKDRMSVTRDVSDMLSQKAGGRIPYLLARKKTFGADPSIAARVRATDSQLRSLPKSYGKIPVVRRPEFPKAKEVPPPEREEFEAPKPPSSEPFSPEEWRKEQLRKKGAYFTERMNRWDILFPPLLALERVLGHVITNPRVMDWLSKGD